MEFISGSVERVTYYNPENGYTVIRLRSDHRVLTSASNEQGLVTVIGNLPEMAAGEQLELRGQWEKHPKHGTQFRVMFCEKKAPATINGIRRYLGSGLVKGIGPSLAKQIVDFFGIQTLEIIEQNPERLLEVPNIGEKRTHQIAEAWEEQKAVKEIMLFLHDHEISSRMAVKIYKQYGDESLKIVKTNPYQLAQDLYGVGFKTADKIAQSLGLPPDHPSRIDTGTIYTMQQMTDDGHVFLPENELIEKTSALLEVSPTLVNDAIARLIFAEQLHNEPLNRLIPPDTNNTDGLEDFNGQAIYLASLYYSEVGTANSIQKIAQTRTSRLRDLPGLFIFPTFTKDLTDEQISTIQTALSHPVTILTGGPGTGKTTTLKTLIMILETNHKRYALASPTGRAAKRLSQATERPASTIHRLLEFSPTRGFNHNAENPLPVDFVILDEVSMLDLVLANHILKAITPGTHLLLVGDVDQLPSVGAGDVLRDVISSNVVPVCRLTEIFRQKKGSLITMNAHRVNRGHAPLFPENNDDFFLFPAENAEDAADWIQDVVANRIPRKFGLDPRTQIQVLSPLYRGAAGVDALNARLQSVLNPPAKNKPEKSLFGQKFRVGDKVMQLKNDYDKDVFNGDFGLVESISTIDHTLTVDFDGRLVPYDWSEVDMLTLAYAVSVHKSQGGEFPAIVMPIITQHFIMLQRNLVYTAITRAREICVLVGNHRAIHIAIRNNKVSQRYSSLGLRLKYNFSQPPQGTLL